MHRRSTCTWLACKVGWRYVSHVHRTHIVWWRRSCRACRGLLLAAPDHHTHMRLCLCPCLCPHLYLCPDLCPSFVPCPCALSSSRHQVGLIGEAVDLTYTYSHLGSDAAAISQLAAGQPFFEALKKAAHPMVIVGPGVLNRCGGFGGRGSLGGRQGQGWMEGVREAPGQASGCASTEPAEAQPRVS